LHEFALITALLVVLLTLFLVLTERKILAFAQRRMGPTLMGRNGAFQIIADLFKMLTKEIFLIPRPATIMAPIFLALLFTTQILFALNFIWGPSMYLVESVDSMILYHLILILLSNIFFSIVGLLSQSRYAIIGTVRGLVHIISLDIFITIVYSLLVLSSQSANFNDFVIIQSSYWYILIYTPLASSFIIILFLESKRAPFDHAETESEVVAGYSTEYNGPMLLMFFLAEYLHLIISAIHFIIFFLGGWFSFELSSLLIQIFTTYHQINDYTFIFSFDDVHFLRK
jgi:NADH-quinone oxidoreductase subunit H